MHRPSLRAAWLITLLCLPIARVAADGLNFAPCSLAGSGGNGNLSAECATWIQPLDRAEPSGPTIALEVARLRSSALDPAADALTIINGGPGGSSIDLLVDLGVIARMFTRERDVIVIDQRGTGRSSPLACEALSEATNNAQTTDTAALAELCLELLPHDPRFFTTTAGVEDIEALRQALGYERLSVYGVSYGTRVAMQYMRMYPDSVRAAVLDGVVPPTAVLGDQVALHSQDALDAVFARCAAEPYCAERFPDLHAEFDAVSERLKTATVALEIAHPLSGEVTELDMGYEHFAAWIRFALYAPEATALIPLIVHQAYADENYVPVAANALRLMDQITGAINYGMHNAVVCTEDRPFFDDTSGNEERLAETYLGTDFFTALKDMCSVWPVGLMDADMKSPLTSDVPTLVLSGEFDPITPPAWGEAILPGLSQSTHLVAPGQGHGVVARGCVPRVILEFIETPDVSAVDESCVEHLGPYPFFRDRMGPPP